MREWGPAIPSGLTALMGGMETTHIPSTEEIEAARERAAAERAAQGVQSRITSEPLEFQQVEPGYGGGDTIGGQYPTPADEPEFSEEPSGQVHLVVEGAHEKLDTKVVGRTPTSSTFTLTGGKIEVGGQYQPGDVVSFVVTAIVDTVTFKDERDPKTRQVVGRARQHKGYISGIQEQ